MSDPIMQKMLDKFRIKITKQEQDARSSFRGEKFIQVSNPLHDGTEIDGVKMPYVIVPAHDPDYLKAVCGNLRYTVSEPFIPEAAPAKPAPAGYLFQCTHPGCEFIAKTESGLKTHMKNHEE